MILKTREYQQVLEMYAKEVLHEISDMGGSLCEEEPHLYSVADLEECPRRRWITITDVIKNKYLEEYYHSIVDPSKDKERAVEEVCAHMIHLVLGGVVSSYMLSGRVWEVCPRNILLRTHVLGGFDRYGAEHTPWCVCSEMTPTYPSCGRSMSSHLNKIWLTGQCFRHRRAWCQLCGN